MTTPHKSFPFEFKADGESGTFEALVAVFNNVDGVGDRILPGAFTKTLNEWRQSGDPVPVIFNHDWASPDAHIGVAYPRDIKQTPKGLLVKGHLDIEDNPVARQVYRLMQRRSLKEFSFGYRVPPGGEQRARDGANDISEIVLVEVGPTLKGCNPATELHAVKSALAVEPPSERDLRRRSELADRDLKAPALSMPTATPSAPLAERLESELAEVKGQIASVSRALEQKRPAAGSESDLRRASDQLDRSLKGADLPDPSLAEVPEEEEPAAAEPAEPAAEEELRKRSSMVERDLQTEGLPVPAATQMAASRDELEDQLATLGAKVRDLEKQLEVAKSLPVVTLTESDLRRRSEKVDRGLKARKLPAATRAKQAEPEPESPELAEVKAQLARVQEQLQEALKPAPSEADLRRDSEKVDRALKSSGLPAAARAAVPRPESVELAELKAQLAEVRAQLEDALTPKPSEADLRRASEQVDRGLKASDLPPAADETEPDALAAQVETLTADLAEVKSMLADARKPPPASEAELRLATERLGREDTKAQLPTTQPLRELVDQSQARAQIAQAQLEVLKALPDIGKRGKRLASDLRERLDAAGVERYGGRDIYVYVDDFDPDEGWVVYYVAGEVTQRRFVQVGYTTDAAGAVALATEEIEVVRTTTYRPKNGSTAEKSGGTTRPRPLDPLRKRSDQAVLEIQSDGASLRKPPTQDTQEPAPELLDASALKRASREVMLAQLTGETV